MNFAKSFTAIVGTILFWVFSWIIFLGWKSLIIIHQSILIWITLIFIVAIIILIVLLINYLNNEWNRKDPLLTIEKELMLILAIMSIWSNLVEFSYCGLLGIFTFLSFKIVIGLSLLTIIITLYVVFVFLYIMLK